MFKEAISFVSVYKWFGLFCPVQPRGILNDPINKKKSLVFTVLLLVVQLEKLYESLCNALFG